MALKEKVIFDTNFLYNKRATSFFGNKEELVQFSKLADIIIPEIVVEELEGKYKRSFGQEKEKFFKTLLPSMLSHNCDVLEIESKIKELKDGEEILYQIIQLTDFSILPEIKKLAINKLPPFEPTDGTDKGFKDTYIYFTILEYLQRIPDKYVFVCVKDQRFKRAFDAHHNIFAIESYKEFLKHRISQFQDDYFLSKVKEELGLEFEKEEVLNFWMNIDDNQVVLVKKAADEFVIEVDSGEIMSIANREHYLTTIDVLISSANFGTTHATIEKLERYINFFSEDDVSRILVSSFQNEQIRWIIEDDDVKQFIGTLFKAHDELEYSEIQAFLEEIFD
ncbi:PIN domain-containing protein [Algibacter sp. L3A6]|uniref:PIN domain-containing protein n=1 Tax=Algibacter sp. L3A6 TaxID=2686366 RepID=UPI00131E6F90|nr:PIN domain-containing protein [Algibacter sp. L3A6]